MASFLPVLQPSLRRKGMLGLSDFHEVISLYCSSLIINLRIDNCDERRVYKGEDISGPIKCGTYMFNISP